jgi:hypothetical protein
LKPRFLAKTKWRTHNSKKKIVAIKIYMKFKWCEALAKKAMAEKRLNEVENDNHVEEIVRMNSCRKNHCISVSKAQCKQCIDCKQAGHTDKQRGKEKFSN